MFSFRFDFRNVKANFITGAVPEGLGLLPHLEQLYAGSALPENEHLTHTSAICLRRDLSYNGFSGEIPETIIRRRDEHGCLLFTKKFREHTSQNSILPKPSKFQFHHNPGSDHS